jgi:peptide/nickel transport system substrate-binding protein
MTQAGDADIVIVNRENVGQIDPLVGERCTYDPALETHGACVNESDQPLTLYIGGPQSTHTDVFFNFNIANTGGNPFLGSGKLDGNGIPPDFFSDEHVRKAFNYCFDWETYIQDALVGEAVQTLTIPIPGMPGYDPDAPHYSYDPDKCVEEFQASTLKSEDGQSLWDVGFRLQVAYNTGNTTRQTIAQILSTNLAQINEKFQVEIIGLPWPTFLRAQRDRSLPLFIVAWAEDIHDPHNWYVPYLTGTYGRRQSLPEEIMGAFQEKVNAGVAESDPAKRQPIYQELNQQVHDLAPQILLATATQRYYLQRWVTGWFYNPIYSGDYFYSLSKE